MNIDSEVVDIEYRTCNCSNKHVPKPHKLIKVEIGEAETEYYLCPTSYYNLTNLLDEWRMCNGEPPGSTRKHYSEYIQRLAREDRYT
jgi:hypothetical protein